MWGPSSLMQKAAPPDDRAADGIMEDSSTSLAPTMLYLTTVDTAPATEESHVLPVTAPWPQVGGPGSWRGPTCPRVPPHTPFQGTSKGQAFGGHREQGWTLAVGTCFLVDTVPEGLSVSLRPWEQDGRRGQRER